MPQSETRQFKMDKQLLLDIIQRQAGSLWKATVEGVQNSVDAGASTCRISCSQGMLIISDDGKGFRSKKEIEDFFEVFGKPHAKEEEKVFGRFRMGRGQLFAYGRNTWRSGEFEMIVDIKEEGLDYQLRTGLEHVDGCTVTVELYSHLKHVEHADIIDQIKKNVKFVRIPIFLNDDGKTITRDHSKIEWDIELAEADIKFRENGPLDVYNQGIKVMSINRYRYGIGGDVVTKVPLKVNFARNDVMSDCPVWLKVAGKIRAHVAEKAVARDSAGNVVNSTRRRPRRRSTTTSTTQTNRRAPILNDADRKRVVNSMKDGDLSSQYARTAKLITLLQDERHITLRVLHGIGRGTITLAPKNERSWSYTVRRMQDAKLTAVVSQVMLDRWGAKDGKELAEIINKTYIEAGVQGYPVRHVPWDTIYKAMATENLILEDKELSRVERIVLETLRKVQSNVAYACRYGTGGARQLFIGSGPNDHWTDGKTFIAINRKEVKRLGACQSAWHHYMMMLIHEYCHKTPSTKTTHAHGVEWHKRMVQAMDGWGIADFVYTCSDRVSRVAAQIPRKLTRTELHGIDQIEQAKKANDELCEDEGLPTELPQPQDATTP